MKIMTKLWIGIVVLIILSPLGLILPQRFKAGSAWGEWGVEELQKLVGYMPKGLAKMSSLWNAPIPDYVFKKEAAQGWPHSNIYYIISAIIGIIIIIIAILIIGRILIKKGD